MDPNSRRTSNGIRHPGSLGQSSRTEAHDQMFAVCKKHLTEQEVARLLEAFKDEVRER